MCFALKYVGTDCFFSKYENFSFLEKYYHVMHHEWTLDLFFIFILFHLLGMLLHLKQQKSSLREKEEFIALFICLCLHGFLYIFLGIKLE